MTLPVEDLLQAVVHMMEAQRQEARAHNVIMEIAVMGSFARAGDKKIAEHQAASDRSARMALTLAGER